MINFGCQKPFHCLLPPHFIFLRSVTEKSLFQIILFGTLLCLSWVPAGSPTNIYSLMQGSSKWRIGLSKSTSNHTSLTQDQFEGEATTELGKSVTCEPFSRVAFHKGKPPNCCVGCPAELYLMNRQRLWAKDKLFSHEWVLLKYFKRKLNIPATILLLASAVLATVIYRLWNLQCAGLGPSRDPGPMVTKAGRW